MSLLIETIRIRNRQICNLKYHNRRFNDARSQLFGQSAFIDLEEYVQIPPDLDDGIFRCRILYDEKIQKIEFHRHTPRTINSLRLVRSDDIDYRFKYSDRKSLELLFEQRAGCDDVLIVKNGFITDT